MQTLQYIHNRKHSVPDLSEGVKRLSAKERILTIRLMEKVEKHPNYVKALGVEASSAKQSLKYRYLPKRPRSDVRSLLLNEKGDSKGDWRME